MAKEIFRTPTRKSVRMPAIVGETWLNSVPLDEEDLRGKVVLVDFWTYSCVNCLRTMPFLRRWWEKYEGLDFLMIGVHAPEFDFEKEVDNVARAVSELGVRWPVVLDNRFQNWHNFANHYWPAKYLADIDGRIVYEHFGEGDYRETEQKIQELLGPLVGAAELPELEPPEQQRDCVHATPETYCGFVRGKLLNKGGYARNEVRSYEAPARIDPDSIALQGRFAVAPQYVEAAEAGAALLLRFRATEVNLVIRSSSGESIIAVSVDGRPLDEDVSGTDVGPDGLLRVDTPRMYNVLKSPRPVEGVLSVSASSGSFQAYAFTFSGCID